MSTALVDHLVVAAASLEQGVTWCENTLGVTPGVGGKHVLMGTHNCVLKLSTVTFPNCYLEIIAIDPDAPAPGRARWFGLDQPALQTSLHEAGPRLVHFVARSTMLDMHRWALITVGHKPGDPVNTSRPTARGILSWQMLVREEGTPECGGALPTLLQWQGTHPAEDMPESGVTLKSLAIQGLPDRTRDVLRLRGVTVAPVRDAADAALTATFGSPRGEVVLRS